VLESLVLYSVGTPADNLAYIVVEPPRHGQLLISGRRVSRSFTQADIDAGDVEYQSDSADQTMTDYFLFAVADGRHDGYLVNGTAHRKPAFFNILIQPASKVGLRWSEIARVNNDGG